MYGVDSTHYAQYTVGEVTLYAGMNQVTGEQLKQLKANQQFMNEVQAGYFTLPDYDNDENEATPTPKRGRPSKRADLIENEATEPEDTTDKPFDE